MKITSFEITAFGPLKNYKMSKNNNLVSFCEDNGYGKSTICSFICAMLYGLPKLSAKDKERNRAIPYGDDFAGGVLELEALGHYYKIIRSFYKKQAQDSLSFYEDNTLVDAAPGEYIFKMDLESFKRTIFINPYDLEIKTSKVLNGKLGHYSEDIMEISSFDNALNYLDKLKKEYKPLRSTEIKGSIAVSKAKINTLKNNIDNLKIKEEALLHKRDEYDSLKKEALRLDDEYKKSTEIEKNNAYLNHYKDLDEKIKVKKEILKSLYDKYPQGMMSELEINDTKEIMSEIISTEAKLENTKLNSDEEHRLSFLKSKFKDVPNEDEIAKKREQIISYKALLNNEELLSNEEALILKKYQYINTENVLKQLMTLTEEYKGSIIDKEEIAENKKPIGLIALASFSLFLTTIGLIGGFFNKFLFILAAVGLIILLASGFVYLNNKVNLNNQSKAIQENKMLKRDIVLKMDKIIIPFGFSSEINGNIDVAVTLFKEEIKKYNDALKHQEIIISNNNENQSRINLIKSELESFISKYGYNDFDYGIAIDNILKDRIRYNELLKRNEENIKIKKEYEQNLENDICKVEAIKERYQIKDDDIEKYLNNTRIDLSESKRINDEIKLLEKEALNYYEEYDLKNKMLIEYNTQPDEAHNEYNKVLNQLNILSSEISSLEADLEMLDDEENNLLNEEEYLKKLNHNYEIITKTIEGLTKASLSIKNKYIKPVKDRFLYYSEILKATLGLDVIIDDEYNVSFRDGATIKEYKELSSGEMTIIMLCYRLAIMDNIFEEKPFIIIDDAFQALDKNNLELVRNMILKLSTNQQIIYFTCHESRKI